MLSSKLIPSSSEVSAANFIVFSNRFRPAVATTLELAAISCAAPSKPKPNAPSLAIPCVALVSKPPSVLLKPTPTLVSLLSSSPAPSALLATNDNPPNTIPPKAVAVPKATSPSLPTNPKSSSPSDSNLLPKLIKPSPKPPPFLPASIVVFLSLSPSAFIVLALSLKPF